MINLRQVNVICLNKKIIERMVKIFLPIQQKFINYNHYSDGSCNPRFIIIHYTGNRGDTAYNNYCYFSEGNRNASANFFIDDNNIIQIIKETQGAWHIGNSIHEPNNHNSIGIEMCCQSNGQVSEKTENNTVELVQYLMKKWNIDINHVWTHYECTKDGENKICPNWSENNWARWNNFKQKVVNGIKPKFEEQELDMLVNVKDFVIDEYYRKNNPDVVKVMGDSHEAFVNHYREYGKKEGRKANALPDDFNAGQYLINNPDVNEAVNRGETTACVHYIWYGWKEGRSYKKQEDNTEESNSNKACETFYRVVTGSYKERENADEQLNKLKEAGFESFIDIYKK